MSARFPVAALGVHDRTGFSCGVAALDRYFREQVTQDMRRRASACFVTVDAAVSLKSCLTRRNWPRRWNVPATFTGVWRS